MVPPVPPVVKSCLKQRSKTCEEQVSYTPSASTYHHIATPAAANAVPNTVMAWELYTNHAPHVRYYGMCTAYALAVLELRLKKHTYRRQTSVETDRSNFEGPGHWQVNKLLFECRCHHSVKGFATRIKVFQFHSLTVVVQDVFHAPCSWWLPGEGGGEGRQRLLLTPEREDATSTTSSISTIVCM